MAPIAYAGRASRTALSRIIRPPAVSSSEHHPHKYLSIFAIRGEKWIIFNLSQLKGSHISFIEQWRESFISEVILAQCMSPKDTAPKIFGITKKRRCSVKVAMENSF
jgi:hypothetical protein